MQGKFGGANIGFGFQVANDIETVDSSTRISSLLTANGVNHPSGTISSVDLDGELFIRPCAFIKAGTDGTIGGAMGAGVVVGWW